MLNGSFGTCLWEGFHKFGDLIDESLFPCEVSPCESWHSYKISYLLMLTAVPLRQAPLHLFQVFYRRVQRK